MPTMNMNKAPPKGASAHKWRPQPDGNSCSVTSTPPTRVGTQEIRCSPRYRKYAPDGWPQRFGPAHEEARADPAG